MKIGARTLKTGIAILISLAIPFILGFPEVSDLAAISAIYSLQPSVKKSFGVVKERILANTLGGIVAVLMSLALGNSLLTIAFASALLIAILHQVKLDSVIGLAAVTLIVIMLTEKDAIVADAILRVLATIIGVVVTFFVNTLVLPPKYDKRLLTKIDNVTDELTKYTRASLRKNSQFAILKEDLKWIRKELRSMEQLLSLLIDQNSFWYLKKPYSSLRVVAVYRQFIEASKAACHLISALHKSENIYNHFPQNTRIIIRERVETLMSAHEQILMKFNGRIMPDDVNFIAYKASLRKTFMTTFFSEASLESYMKNDYGQSNSVIHLMSAILEYEEELQHLNILVRSYIKHHPGIYRINLEHTERD